MKLFIVQGAMKESYREAYDVSAPSFYVKKIGATWIIPTRNRVCNKYQLHLNN